MQEEWIPIVMFISMAVVLVVWLYFRHRSKVEMQQTFRMALDKGAELTPEIINQLGNPEPSKDRDLRRGLIWLSLAVGLALCGLAIPDEEAFRGMLAGAAFPFSIGMAFMIMYAYGSRK
jgi:cbb3-type cytochrome oxidase subunit 3